MCKHYTIYKINKIVFFQNLYVICWRINTYEYLYKFNFNCKFVFANCLIAIEKDLNLFVLVVILLYVCKYTSLIYNFMFSLNYVIFTRIEYV